MEATTCSCPRVSGRCCRKSTIGKEATYCTKELESKFLHERAREEDLNELAQERNKSSQKLSFGLGELE